MHTFIGENLTARVARLLGSEIVGGGYSPGEVLPNEAQLGERFDVGRSAIREGVKLLTSKGLVDARPRRGTVVQPMTDWNYLDPDILQWTQEASSDSKFLLELAEMRLAFEPSAARLAAISATPADIERMRLALTEMEQAQDGRGDPIRADLRFHEAIVSASHNRFMRPLVALIGTALQLSFRVTNAATGRQGGDVAAHGRVFDAIREGNPDGAQAAMTDLLGDVRSVLRASTQSQTYSDPS